VLSEGLLRDLLEFIVSRFGTDLEFTVESGRPTSREKLRIMKENGVNRIAVNPQTLNDRTLELIGRSHTVEDFFRGFEMAREFGFVINSDIIAGLPGEGLADFERTLEGLLPLKPENITVHTLSVKRASNLNEALSEYEASFVDASEAAKMLEIAEVMLERFGYEPYYLYRQKNTVGLLENVGWSLPGRECLYNVGMMAEVQTVYGAGAGAVSKFVDGDRITRKFNAKDAGVYVGRMEMGCQ
jgi:oxygen-independent coproporphyrinogen-3 oxidase